ncbi:hypothetical protein BDF19DRAFT_424944 [Syncephalis fuscata]|nr:hypothetical protein BDF19DRAFT_424944 [Syncephalis fuscata]
MDINNSGNSSNKNQIHHVHGHHYTRPHNTSSTLGTAGEFSVDVNNRCHGLSDTAYNANQQEAERRQQVSAHQPHSLEDLVDIMPSPEESNWHWVETGNVGKLAWAAQENLPQLPPCDITPVEESNDSASLSFKMSTSDALSIAATSDVPVVDQALKRGNRALALRQYEEAVQAYGEASQLLGEQLGEDAPEYADVLVLYGRALLQNAVEQNGVLGQDATAMASTAEDNADDAGGGGGEEKDEKESEDNNDAKEGDDNQEEQKDNKEEGEEEQDEEPSDDFGMAWEILDLARVIYAREDNEESKEKLGDVYMLLGDVSLESENFDQAYKDYEDALQIKQALYKPDDRRLAEAYPL